MKRTLRQPLRVGLAAMLLGLPVYADDIQIAEAATPPAVLESAAETDSVEAAYTAARENAAQTAAAADAQNSAAPSDAAAAAPADEPETVAVPTEPGVQKAQEPEKQAEPAAEAVQEPAAEAAAVQEQKQEENRLEPYLGKTITKQIIEGNATVPAEDVLAALKTKPGMEFTEAGLTEDLSAIYDMGWFYDLHPEFKAVPEGVQVIYHVLENPVYKSVKVQGNTVIDSKRVDACFDLEQGKVANLKQINKSVQKLEEEYRSNGYILARVTDVHMEQDGTLNVTVNEGIVEDFKVKGNVKCKDYVITREMKLKKGKPFNAKDARRSMQRVYNLGYFEDVNIKLNPGREPNSVEVEISVVEMNTGTFGIGAGYSNADGFVGMVSIGDKNFRGTGDRVNIRWEFGGEDNKNYDFSYTRPWIDDKETSATLNLYDITNEYADYNIDGDEIARYDKKRRGQELTFSRKTDNEFISNYITLKNREDIYKGEADGYEGDTDQYYEKQFTNSGKYESWMPSTPEERRKENFGTTRSITLGRVFDSRDNIYDPHEGKRIGYSLEWAGGLGGDFDFTKFTADYRYYYRAGGESVWALNLGAGYADGDMPLSQRFSMGGSDTLRGYEDDQFRGNSMVKATLEYRFPIVKKVQGVLFTDNGYAWDKRHEDEFDFGLIKNSYGVGLRINSPLGPVKLDYGYGEDGGKFHFSFGGQF
ncbi:MAG: BamA/TamA family outer membrane protein [Phascolarctobacterium sp.]|uniref:BamA/OMP85 family outer membrane protein n=1 Tax=Phascolarctobacterium sp. TaxID=2049039 RepID=UPI0026DAF338|nr:BamA/TamA family outer membrane protein [Phascolarctobacterium sp.]MDO4921727.1 BamA/TamA family outer membrane protein [Phascolarctobacterium sp.]